MFKNKGKGEILQNNQSLFASSQLQLANYKLKSIAHYGVK
jgi:hypothetical protein